MTKKKLAGRILQIIIVLFGVSIITFSLTYLAPGDPVKAMYAAGGNIPSEAVMASMRSQMGLNDPFPVQYLRWLSGCLQGDFGISYSLNKPVVTVLLQRLWPTLKLTLLSLLIMLTAAILMGVYSALKHNQAADYVIRGITFAGVSLPGFWVGLMLIYIVSLKLKLLPVISSGTGLKTIILPAVTLAFSMAAKYTRQVRAAVLTELHQDYVIGAQARGLKKSIILWRHVFPNALLPLVTLLGLSLGSLLGGTAVVEVIFSYPGLGNLAVSAVAARDYPLIQGYVLWIALIYMVINLLVDISYQLLDPRTKDRYPS